MDPLDRAPEQPESVATQRALFVALDRQTPNVLVPLNNRYGMYVRFPTPGNPNNTGVIMQCYPTKGTCTIVEQSPTEDQAEAMQEGRQSREFSLADIQALNPQLHFDLRPEKTLEFRQVHLRLFQGGKYMPTQPLSVWVKRSKVQSPQTGHLQEGELLFYGDETEGRFAKRFVVDVGGGDWYGITPDSLAQLNPDLELFLDGTQMEVHPQPMLPAQPEAARLHETGPTPPKPDPAATMTQSRWSLGGLLSRFRKPNS